jgi:hypothetical protein
VPGHADNFIAGFGFYFRGYLIQVFLFAAADNDFRASQGESLGYGVAEVSGTTEYEGYFAFKRKAFYVHALLLLMIFY